MPDAGEQLALSFVVPVYNEEGNVGPLHAELSEVAARLGDPYEYLFVNDGSRDATLERLRLLAAHDPRLRIVDLDGNFGEAAALSAGFAHARGAVVVTLDGDGQNPPADVPQLLAALGPDVDVVSGRRAERKEAFLTRVLPSRVANWLIARVTRIPVYDCGCGLKAYRREVLIGAQLPRGMNRFLPAILGVEAGRVREVMVGDRPRGSGASHYGLGRIAVVLRDLLALPLLVRRPLPGRRLARGLAIAAAAFVGVAGTAFAVALASAAARHAALGVTLTAALAAALFGTVGHNVNRFVWARHHGVFRVRRTLHENLPREHRDRGRWILGQEPTPNLQPR